MFTKELDLLSAHLLHRNLYSLETFFERVPLQDYWVVIGYGVTFLVICIFAVGASRAIAYDDGLPLVNRSFALEPRIFARFRWAFGARKILEDADEKFRGEPYRLARGDADIVVLPPRFITELNKKPQSLISSRKSHAMSLLGNLNGMDAVLETDLHVKMLLNRISPALSELFKPANSRIMETLTNLFPQSTKDWSTVKPLDKIVLCISRGITLAVFGPPACDDMLLNKTFVKHTQHVFTIGFAMRLVPWFLQPALVWCLPAKWHIRWTWETLRRFVYPEVERRLHEKAEAGRPNLDLISCMVQDAKRPQDANPELLAGLIGSIAAGATYSSAALIIGVISDLVAQPHFLEEIREEIRAKHAEVKGNWTSKTFDGLVKLDSAMKETLRLAPGALIIYSRKILGDITLSSGLKLQKGQYITVSGHSRAMDPDVFPNPQVYDALRSYNQNLGEHRARPFNNVLADDFRWGAGRWACPGRHIATQTSKAILVKLLDEYDFKFLDGKRPNNALLHEFVFFHPDTKMLVRRRESNCGIVFS